MITLGSAIADSAMLSLGGDQDPEITRGVRREDLDVRVSPAEGVRRPLDSLVRPVEAFAGISAVRRGEGVLSSVVREGRVAGEVSVHVRVRSEAPQLR